MRLVVTFDSISHALFFQAVCKERHLSCALVPLPRTLSSSCGYAAEGEVETVEKLVELMKEQNLAWEAVHEPAGDDFRLLCRNE